MAEYAVIRLGRHEDDAISWCICSDQSSMVIEEGELINASQLEQLKNRCHQKKLYILVAGECITFHQVAFSGRFNRHIRKALPFLIEDAVADDIDQLHVTLVAQRGQQLILAVVARQQMDNWLSWLDNAGLKPTALLVETLLLPWKEGEWSACHYQQKWIIRMSADSGMVLEEKLAPFVLQQYETLPPISCYSPLAEPKDGWKPVSLPGIDSTIALLAREVKSCSVNLLHGPYQSRAEWLRILQPWKRIVIAAGVCCCLVVLNKFVLLFQLSNESSERKQQITRYYRQLFPNESRIINPRQQMAQHLLTLEKDKSPSDFFWILYRIQPVFNKSEQIQVDKLQFDERLTELKLVLRVKGFADFEHLYQELSKQFSVQQSAIKDKSEYVEGTLTIKDKNKR